MIESRPLTELDPAINNNIQLYSNEQTDTVKMNKSDTKRKFKN